MTSGPILELAVDGAEPGDVVRLSAPGRAEVAVRARSAQAVIREVELVVNGRVVAATTVDAAVTELRLDERVEIAAGSWIAARARSRHHIESAFATSMAAHTSPIYVEVAGRPLPPAADDAAVVEQVMLGTRTWLAELAPIVDPAERARMLAFLDATLTTFRQRIADATLRG